MVQRLDDRHLQTLFGKALANAVQHRDSQLDPRPLRVHGGRSPRGARLVAGGTGDRHKGFEAAKDDVVQIREPDQVVKIGAANRGDLGAQLAVGSIARDRGKEQARE